MRASQTRQVTRQLGYMLQCFSHKPVSSPDARRTSAKILPEALLMPILSPLLPGCPQMRASRQVMRCANPHPVHFTCSPGVGLPFTSRHQPPRRGRGVRRGGGGSKKFPHFGGIFEFPISF